MGTIKKGFDAVEISLLSINRIEIIVETILLYYVIFCKFPIIPLHDVRVQKVFKGVIIGH